MPLHKLSFQKAGGALLVILAIISLSFSEKSSDQKRPSQTARQGSRPQYVSGEVVLKFKPSARIELGKAGGAAVTTGIASIGKLFQKFQGEELKPIFPGLTRSVRPDEVDLTRFYRFRYRDGSEPKKVARELQSTHAIEYAEPRYIRYVNFTPNDPDYGRQWYIRKIQADRAWDVTKGDTSVIIGMIDTGIDWRHPDIRPNLWHNPHPGQNQNFPADSIGWDFGGLDGTPDNNPDEDRADHGTGTAGVALAAADNAVGIAGVGFKCKLMAVKTSQDNSRDANGFPFILYGYEGLVYAANNGASVINASWGGGGYSQFEQDVINYVTGKGALVVAAAGNGGSSEPIYPAGYAHVLAAAATDSTDHRSIWSFGASSNFGPHIGVSAPGSSIYTTFKQPLYLTLDGTSFSAPVVSGTAALVKSLHRNWTPEQVAQQVRVTADGINQLNPAFTKQLGFGRVNAFRAVSDSSSPGLQMISFTISDSIGGNNDGSIDPNETIRIVGQFKNFLHATTSASAQLSTTDPFITVTSGSVALGTVSTLQTASNTLTPFVFQVRPDAPENHKAVFYVNFADGSYLDYTGFTLNINATYKDHNINNITMTVTSKGTLAFNDYPDNFQGSGFVFHRGGEDNLLFEGALMAGTDVGHIVDAARGETQEIQDTDYTSLKRFYFLQSAVSDQDGLSVFTDTAAGSNQIGLRVNLNTYAFKNAPDDDYIILKYTLVNRKATPITSLRAGLYFDWDVGSVNNNVTRYDPVRGLGYIYDTDPLGSRTYVGTVLLSSNPLQFRAIDNDNTTPGNPWGVYDGFTKAEKWEAISGGTTHTQEGPGDVSFVIGAGPLSIAANDSLVIGFALVAGTDSSDLKANAEAAQRKWGIITTDVQRISSQIPSTFSLDQNYPNPFNPTTKIRYDLPHESRVTLSVFNLLGQEVARLIDAHQSAGQYEVSFEASSISSGVYFYRIQAASYTAVRKMMIVR